MCVCVPLSGTTPVGLWPLITGQPLDGGEVRVTDLEEEEVEDDGRAEGEDTAPLLPPSALFDTPNYPPFHMFVSPRGKAAWPCQRS